jgi:hypothetical protein
MISVHVNLHVLIYQAFKTSCFSIGLLKVMLLVELLCVLSTLIATIYPYVEGLVCTDLVSEQVLFDFVWSHLCKQEGVERFVQQIIVNQLYK